MYEDVNDIKPNISRGTNSTILNEPSSSLSTSNSNRQNGLPDIQNIEENSQDQWDDYCYVCNQAAMMKAAFWVVVTNVHMFFITCVTFPQFPSKWMNYPMIGFARFVHQQIH